MKEPGRWIRITKLKHQRPNKENTAERMMVLKQVTTALDLMGIRYETKGKTHFTIKVVTDAYWINGKKPQFVIIDDIYKDLL